MMTQQGWLRYRQKSGIVGRLAGFNRDHKLWFVLLTNCSISGYKDDTGLLKPEVNFDLKHSALTINQEEANQFEIISEKYHIVIVAEDHNSVLDWVSAIQTARSLAHGVSPAPKQSQRKASHNDDTSSVESGIYKMAMEGSPLEYDFNGVPDEYEWENPTSTNPSPSLTSNPDEETTLFQLSKELAIARESLVKCNDRIASYQEVLASRDQQLFEIQDRINNQEAGRNQIMKSEGYQNMAEQARSYREQNRLLNEEVLKLHQACKKHQVQAQQQRKRADKLSMELLKTQRDYVNVMNHCVYHPLVDIEDGVRFIVAEPTRHINHLKTLTRTMKQENDRILGCAIPTVGKSEHTDMFGFVHHLSHEVLQVEYVTNHLTDAYDALLDGNEENQKIIKKWKTFIHDHSEKFEVTTQLQKLILQCMPAQYRSYIWQKFIHHYVADLRQSRGEGYFEELLKHQEIYKLDKDFSKSLKQILMDVPRTMPGNRDFTQNDSPLRDRLTRVLTAFCIHAPKIGYCQGFNFLAGASLLFLEEVDSFWFIIAVIEVIFPEDYYRNGLAGLLADQYVLQKILPFETPKLSDHLSKFPEVDIAAVTTGWFLGLFFDCLPFKTLIRVWDCFLAFGHQAVFRVSCAILKQFEDRLLELHEPSHLLHAIKNIPKLCTHPEQLIKEAFDNLHNFPAWSDILEQRSKLEVDLIEEHEKKMQQRRHYDERMMMLDHFEESHLLQRNEDRWNFDCGTVSPSGGVLLSASNRLTQNSRVYISDCSIDSVELLAIPITSRIMCMLVVDDDVILVGLFTGQLQAYSLSRCCICWSTSLSDAVLSVATIDSVLYVGTADGKLHVLQVSVNGYPSKPTLVDSVELSKRPTTYICTIPSQSVVWVASGPAIYVINMSTNETDGFFLISAKLEQVSIMTMTLDGKFVWIATRGSNVLQLHSTSAFSSPAVLVYDVSREMKLASTYPMMPDEGDIGAPCPERITSLLLNNESKMWVGTANGKIKIFNLIEEEIILQPDDSYDPLSCDSPSREAEITLQLEVTINVTEKPIRCLLKSRVNLDQVVLSCTGSFGDVDSVLLWTPSGERIKPEDDDVECPPARSLSLPTLPAVLEGSKVIEEGESSNSLGSSSRSGEVDVKSETGAEDATIMSSMKSAVRSYRNKPKIKRFINLLANPTNNQ